MDQATESTPFSLRDKPPALQWGLLLTASLAFIIPLELVSCGCC